MLDFAIRYISRIASSCGERGSRGGGGAPPSPDDPPNSFLNMN